ncbi:MAG: ABC transporter substrate-binding protein [Anaerolineae bacterium]|jgi:ABC-type nitrate/sulfonate/bicarbonate transport system substrate-binding protein|nr:ABC transporter substrate-binding protein [Chloroflexota bacterium]
MGRGILSRFERCGWLRSILLATLALVLLGCGKATELEPATLLLDWVPNTNHTGLYVALEKGWYAEEGIALSIESPSDPSAALRQVAAGNAEFGVSFQEEVTIARSTDIPVVSIAAVIQHNTSGFAALASSGIADPAGFEGRTYASYSLPIEPAIMGSLMACYNADASKVQFVDVGFDAFPALLSGQVDLAWIFMGWDGVQAELKGQELTVFPLYGSCVPDYYTPVLIAGEDTLANKADLTRRFMRATVRGYDYAIQNPDEAAEILLKYTPESDPELIRASQRYLSPRYQDDATAWGQQELSVWENLNQWMAENKLIDAAIDAQAAFTSEFLP